MKRRLPRPLLPSSVIRSRRQYIPLTGQENLGSGDGPGACTRLLSVECLVDIELSGMRCLKNPMKVVLWEEGLKIHIDSESGLTRPPILFHCFTSIARRGASVMFPKRFRDHYPDSVDKVEEVLSFAIPTLMLPCKESTIRCMQGQDYLIRSRSCACSASSCSHDHPNTTARGRRFAWHPLFSYQYLINTVAFR